MLSGMFKLSEGEGAPPTMVALVVARALKVSPAFAKVSKPLHVNEKS